MAEQIEVNLWVRAILFYNGAMKILFWSLLMVIFLSEYSFDRTTEKCYKLHRRGLTWPRAYMTCMAEGAHLAVVNSEKEFAVLRDLFNRNSGSVIFSEHTEYVAIGFSDPNDGGSWRTIHGKIFK